MRRFSFFLASAGVSCAVALSAAQGSKASTYKNVQVLKDVPDAQLMPAMFFMKGSLGVPCTFCHVDYAHFESDAKPEKQTARRMIQMVQNLNAHSFDGRQRVTCNTCHRGQTSPDAPLAFAPPAPGPVALRAEDAGALPTVDEVFAHYLDATGGKPALDRVTSILVRGQRTASEGWTAPVERALKAPDAAVSSFFLNGTNWRNGFDGHDGWNQDNHAVRVSDAEGIEAFRVESSVLIPSTVRPLYGELRVTGRATVGDRAAITVEGTLPSGRREQLAFDAAKGFLLRISRSSPTPFGPMPDELDIEDYQPVGTLTLPRTLSHLKPDFSYIDRFDAVTPNAAVTSAQFARPGGGK